MNRSAVRVAFVAGALVAATIPAALVSFRSEPVPRPRPAPASAPDPALDREPVNYRGPITVLPGGWEGDHPSAAVVPRAPHDFIIDDCSRLDVPPNDNTAIDPELHILEVSWWDHGMGVSRMLTIYYDSPTCRAHEEVARDVAFAEQHADGP